MKKTLVFAALMASSVIAHAESLHIRLYKDFATTGVVLPAGEYTVTPAIGSTGVVLMKSSTMTAFVFARIYTPAPPAKQTISLELSKDKSFDLKSAPISLSLK